MPASVHLGQPGVVLPFDRCTAYTHPLPLAPTTIEMPSESRRAWFGEDSTIWLPAPNSRSHLRVTVTACGETAPARTPAVCACPACATCEAGVARAEPAPEPEPAKITVVTIAATTPAESERRLAGTVKRLRRGVKERITCRSRRLGAMT